MKDFIGHFLSFAIYMYLCGQGMHSQCIAHCSVYVYIYTHAITHLYM